MGRAWRSFTPAFVACAITISGLAQAETDDLEKAARAYDEGVTAYDKAEFGRAARAFLRADTLVPSPDAVSNALSASVRGGKHLLVIDASARILDRDDAPAELKTRARKARVFAASKLAELRLECEPEPCGMTVDGKATKPGSRFVLPGDHRLVVIARDGHESEKTVQLQAGTTYEVLLHAVGKGEAARDPDLEAKAVEKAAPPPKAGELVRRGDGGPGDSGTDTGWSPGVFYAGLGLTIAVAGFTTWSGLDTLAAKSDLPQEPTQKQVDDVESRVQRTDLLLAGSVLLAGVTAYVGLSLVDWGSPDDDAAGGSVRLAGTSLRLEGRF